MRELASFCLLDTAARDIYTLSLHDALPISPALELLGSLRRLTGVALEGAIAGPFEGALYRGAANHLGQRRDHGRLDDPRSEEHTSELQSLAYLVCRLLLEKKKSQFAF